MSEHGVFESLQGSEGEKKVATAATQRKLDAALFDVKQRFGEFLFQAKDLPEFRDRLAMVRDDAYKVVDQHIIPVTSVMRRLGLTGRNGALEKEFKQRLATGFEPVQPSGGSMAPENFESPNPGATPAGAGQMSLPGMELPGSVRAGRVAAPSMNTQGAGMSAQVAQGKPVQVPRVPQMKPPTPAAIANPESAHTNMVARRLEACWPGCDKDEAHAKKVHKDKEGRRLRSDVTFGDAVADTETFHPNPNKGKVLVNDGDFHAYQNKMDQGAPDKVKRDFVHNPEGQEHSGDPALVNFVKDREPWKQSNLLVAQYSDWCETNGLRKASLNNLDRYAENLNDAAYFTLAKVITADPIPSGSGNTLGPGGTDDPNQHPEDVGPTWTPQGTGGAKYPWSWRYK